MDGCKEDYMDLRIRLFLDEVIALTNQFDDLPLECRRLVLESVMHLVEKEANKAIAIASQEGENAKDVLKNKLGELSIGGNSSERVQSEQDGLCDR